MKTKSFLLNILFFILAFTFIGCETENANDQVTLEEIEIPEDTDVKMADKEEIEEPDDRED